MASDIKLNDSTVVVEGNVGVGTASPVRMLHVEGSEIHSGGGGSGFSFSDRTRGLGERWVWYAQDGEARLWKNADQVTVKQDAQGIPELSVMKLAALLGLTTGQINGMSPLFAGGPPNLHVNTRNLSLARSDAQAPVFHKALSHAEDDRLIINESRGYTNGVTIDGNVHVTGTLSQASSVALKENITELSGPEAMTTLQGLNAVKYIYKADENKEQRLGFIAEEVPDLVASSDRDRLSPMDIVAVLTKAVQEQQRVISNLADEMRVMRQERTQREPDPSW